MRGVTRLRVAIVCAIVATAAIAVGAGAVGAKSGSSKTSGKLYVGINPQAKSGIQFLAGQGVDKALGSDAVTFTIKPLSKSTGVITANAIKVTLWTSGGSLTGTGGATLTVTGMPKAGDVTVSDGKISLTKGTGALKGHSFKATFTGSGNIVSGEYTFVYKGTYK